MQKFRPAAAMLNAAIIELERCFAVRTGIWSAVSQTGEPYVVICGADRHDGDSAPVWPTAEEAVAAWRGQAERYAAGKQGSYLYWRTMPALEPKDGGHRVYSRMLITTRQECMRINGDGAVVPIEPAPGGE